MLCLLTITIVTLKHNEKKSQFELPRQPVYKKKTKKQKKTKKKHNGTNTKLKQSKSLTIRTPTKYSSIVD
jgi:biopolymer transport protein ExbD